MERMGNILAREATRRASLRARKAAPPDETTAPSGAASSVPTVRSPSPTAPRLQRGGATVPLNRRASTSRPLASSSATVSEVQSPAPAQRRHPVAPRQPDILSKPPRTVAADVVYGDRVLEMPASYQTRHIDAREVVATSAGSRSVAYRAVGSVVAQGPGERTPRNPPSRARSHRSANDMAIGDVVRSFMAGRPAGDAVDSDNRPLQSAQRGLMRPANDDTCPRCGGTGYLRLDVPVGDPSFGQAIPCSCKEVQREERRRQDLRRLSSLEPFLDKTFETFDARAIPSVKEAFEIARRYADQPDGWLVLSGSYGAGKTHLAAAIANYRLSEGSPVFFSIVPDLLDHLRAAFAPHSEIPYDEMFDKVREVELLVLDDLGAENGTAWASEKLFQLINYRYNFKMPTVITTNHRLLSHMDERIRSRLSDLSFVRNVLIDAPDFRERRAGRGPQAGGSPGYGKRMPRH